ncbi:MAG: hypothetical protein ACRDY4_01825, partial [Acidimicrobiia bacterium]
PSRPPVGEGHAGKPQAEGSIMSKLGQVGELGQVGQVGELGAPAPAVRFEPCAALDLDPECPWCSCTACGWPADEHGDEQAPVVAIASVVRATALAVETGLRQAS